MYRISDKAAQSLLSQWRERLSKDYDRSYKDGLNDCIYDLQQLLSMSLEFYPDDIIYESGDPMLYENMEDYFNSLEADGYLSSLAAHEEI